MGVRHDGAGSEPCGPLVSDTAVSHQKYEEGESRPGSPANPTLRTMLALSQVLGVAVASLIPPDAPDLRSR